jgi:hypothetical protein
MAGIAFTQLAVPPITDKDLCILRVRAKTGRVQISLIQEVARDNNAVALAGSPAHINIYESDDRLTWNKLTAADVVVASGGQAITNVITNKAYLKLVGHTVGGSGALIKADIVFQGIQYFGQVDLDLEGKSGFGYDTDAPVTGSDLAGGVFDNKAGTAQFGSTPWNSGPTA